MSNSYIFSNKKGIIRIGTVANVNLNDEIKPVVFDNNCSNLTGWTNNGFIVSTKGGQTCFLGTVSNNYIYINTGIPSLKGYSINFNIYLTGGSPDFLFASNSSGAGQLLRFEQKYTNGSGFASTASWTDLSGTSLTYTWTQNTWLAISISITLDGIATFSVNGVTSEITYAIADNGGYIGIQTGCGCGSISVNNIIII